MVKVRIPWSGWTAVRKIGEGSYGAVYEIERPIGDMKERAALKIITIPKSQEEAQSLRAYGYDENSLISRYEEEKKKIIKEYQIMMSMKGHSNIVSCEDISEEPLKAGIGWRIYIRMEYLTPLLKYKQNRKSRPLSEAEVRKIGMDLCQALVLCEQKHIVHRDIKPENIMVSEYGSFKLGDFGIARTMDHATTATNIGTRPYMAPEVVQGKHYDHRVDIYSLGMVLYWLLNNDKLPFWPQDHVPDYETAQQAYEKRIRGDALPAPAAGSAALKKVVLKACAYNPADRYGSAKEMMDALGGAGTRKPTDAAGSGKGTSSAGTAGTATAGWSSGSSKGTAGWSSGSSHGTAGWSSGSSHGASGWSSGSSKGTAGWNSGSSSSGAETGTGGSAWEDTSGTMDAPGWGKHSSASSQHKPNGEDSGRTQGIGWKGKKGTSSAEPQNRNGTSEKPAQEEKKSKPLFYKGRAAVWVIVTIICSVLSMYAGKAVYASFDVSGAEWISWFVFWYGGPLLTLTVLPLGKILLYIDYFVQIIWWIALLYEMIAMPDAVVTVFAFGAVGLAGFLEHWTFKWILRN